MQASEILSKAADLIEPEGAWMQGGYSNGVTVVSGSCWCAAGAVYAAHGNWRDPVARDAVRVLYTALNLPYDDEDDDVIGAWNDAPERTQAEVVSALRQAAHLAKEQEQEISQ